MGCFCCALLLGLLAAQVLAQENGLPNPTADSSSHPGTTVAAGFFRRVFNAARDLVSPVRHDPSTTVSTTTPRSPAASPHADLWFMQEPQLKGSAPMNFSLRVVNEDLSAAGVSDVYDEGSAIYIEARVQTTSGILFPKIFIDECYGTDTKEEIHPRRPYVIADNHGCLYSVESETGASWFWKEDSVIIFIVPAFLVTGEPVEEIYIHCFLTVWSQKTPTSSSKKACYFNKALSSWKNIDEPSKPSVCNCCDHFCPMEFPHLGNFKASFVGEGRLHREVVGPLTVLKQNISWFAEDCRTMKDMLLVSFALLVSFTLMFFFTGALLTLVVLLTHYFWSRKGHRLLQNRMEKLSDTELKTVTGALEIVEGTEESNLDYCKLKGDTPEKA